MASGEGKREIGGFVLVKRLGKGGMGTVYLANEKSMDREVALKMLSPKLTRDKEFVKRFLAEARAAGKLTHSNIVQVHDVGEIDGTYFICMEYVEGGSLTDLLAEQGRMDPETGASIALDVAKGLAYAEELGIVHCDIKPDNIMITARGQAKIADLGVARKASDASAGDKGKVLGSPHYMPPEQAQGRAVDHRTDIYALGCTLFRVLAGRTLFSGATPRDVMKKQVFEEAPDICTIVPEVSRSVGNVIKKMLEKNPDDRYQTCAELVEALEKAAKGGAEKKGGKKKVARRTRVVGAGRRGATAATRISRHKSSSSIIYIPLAIVFIAAAFGGYYYWDITRVRAEKDKLAAVRTLMEEGKFDEASNELESVNRITDAISREVGSLKNDIKGKKLELQADAHWKKMWVAYEEKRNSGTAPKELVAELKKMLTLLGRGNSDKVAEVRKEIETQLMKVKGTSRRGRR